MAEIVENSKKFKVIKVTRAEINNAFGSLGICDACNCSAWTGYYIAVLNSWYCESDYNRFLDAAINHESDHVVEEANFQHAKELLNIQ